MFALFKKNLFNKPTKKCKLWAYKQVENIMYKKSQSEK